MALPVLRDAEELRQKLSSSRAILKPESHEIFLSHAGKQKPFVFDLYNDFVRGFPSIDPFFDKSSSSLPLGEEFPDRIFKAARECVVAVVILTKEYVTSKWPMLELLAFVEAQKFNPRLKILPVFFDDLPTSNLDHHIIVDESWVAAWKNMPSGAHRETTITVELCKEALRKLRKINGLVLTNNMPHESLRREIVEAALKFVPSSPELDTENIQGCLRLCETISEMFRKNHRGVYCLGLYGMGGLGKTTMCKALCSYFELLSVRKVCHLEIGSDETDMKEMKFKRYIKILRSLSDVPKDQIDEIESSHTDYKVEKYVQKCLSDKQPKFLAVDNVHGPLGSCEEASDYLNWLSEGSIIVITSRSRDNVLSVTDEEDFCKPIPVLEEDEATTLFLKIAAPKKNRGSLSSQQIEIIRKCLQICFFPSNIEANREQDGIKVDDRIVNGESGHYHPLALRAVASYLNGLSSGQENPFLYWEEELKNENMLFYARHSVDVIEVLGIGFNDRSMCALSKQLFIDVALYAPQAVGAEDIFDWLVSIHQCSRQSVKEKLKILRRKCFLSYDKCKSSEESCKNISMHELYRDFAKAYLGKENEEWSKFGVYDDGDQHPRPSLEDSGWSRVPRIYLRSLVNSDLAKVKEWRSVTVVHLVGCGEITTFSIGELVSLRQLEISDCSKLEVLSWTQDIETKGNWGNKLRFVRLSDNKSLRTLPNFSDCSELRSFTVIECSSSVEPLQFHNCSHLQVLHLGGNDVPEVQSVQSCPELRSVRLRWKATHKGLPLLDELPCLSELEIKGSCLSKLENQGASDLLSCDMMDFSSFLGKEKFVKQHPKDSVCHDFTRIRGLTKLQRVFLSCIPLGNLPVELSAVGSTLQSLNLSGCRLSQVVDFSAFPNLRDLQIRWTNVSEVCGLERLTKLTYLDCSYCFQLQKVPDLRPLSELQVVLFLLCPKLLGIPRLPPRVVVDIEDIRRAILATLAFAKTAPLPPRRFAIGKRPRGISSQDGESAIHSGVSCDGCMMFPLRGPRYSAKPVQNVYSLCSHCFSERCCRNHCSDTEKTKPRWEAEEEWNANYDLCSSCYKISGCPSKYFYEIHHTLRPEQGPKPTSYPNDEYGIWGSFTLWVSSSPFTMPNTCKVLPQGFSASKWREFQLGLVGLKQLKQRPHQWLYARVRPNKTDNALDPHKWRASEHTDVPKRPVRSPPDSNNRRDSVAPEQRDAIVVSR